MTAAYLDEKALHAQIAPHLSRAAFLRTVNALENYGFPKADPLFKGRYWPAVRAWLDAHAGLREPDVVAAPDGPETWGHSDEVEPSRFEAKTAQGRGRHALLGRGEPVAEGRGPLSLPIDPFTAKRHAARN
jgi:hypothetical protein